jgi:FkbM family methyltransferase
LIVAPGAAWSAKLPKIVNEREECNHKLMRSWIKKWKLRPFPNSLTSLKAVQTSWSQFGEDLLLSHLLGQEQTNGFYIDVGCFHPVRYSNTYLFYRRNWRGLCIDPSPIAGAQWQRYRSRDTVITAAVGQARGEAYYVEFDDRPQYNRLYFGDDLSEIKEPCEPSRSSRIPVIPLTEILEKHMPKNTRVDLLSVDCEGMDLEVLRSNDFARFKPRVFVVEDHDLSPDTAVTRFAESVNMKLVAQALVSKIFVDPTMALPFQADSLILH